jgi:hypothetical protein
MHNNPKQKSIVLLSIKCSLVFTFIFVTAFTGKKFIGKTNASARSDVAYTLQIANAKQVSPKEYEFEIYLHNKSDGPIELQVFQCGVGFDGSMLNGGTATIEIVKESSQLNSLQAPQKVLVGNNIHKMNHIDYRFINVLAKAPPGAGAGTVVPNKEKVECDNPGVRIGKFRMTNSVKFLENSSPKHIFSTGPGKEKTNTIIQIYKKSEIFSITKAENNLNYDNPSACNKDIVLNKKK